ncbi:MAG TPA: YkgJ family cysteine cluster protein [Bacteriovoracaceae bacterium]|nr:YkgJ family cysteine cluster protein [Bacteriovoracaceae bacterium]
MNVLGIVKKTFEELRNQPDYIAIVNYVVSRLKRLPTSEERAKFIHQVVDNHNQEVFSHPLVQQLSPCKMGCSACCHTQVSVTRDEARILITKIHEGYPIDLDLLKVQMAAGNDTKEFLKLDYKDRKCIFLKSDGACGVYEDRPSICRTNAVLGQAEQCDTSVEVKPTRLVRTPKADMAIYGSYLSSKSSGTLPHLIGDLLGLSVD